MIKRRNKTKLTFLISNIHLNKYDDRLLTHTSTVHLRQEIPCYECRRLGGRLEVRLHVMAHSDCHHCRKMKKHRHVQFASHGRKIHEPPSVMKFFVCLSCLSPPSFLPHIQATYDIIFSLPPSKNIMDPFSAGFRYKLKKLQLRA